MVGFPESIIPAFKARKRIYMNIFSHFWLLESLWRDLGEQMDKDEIIEIDILRLAKALWHRAWALVLAMLVFGGGAYAYARFAIVPLYRATALMYVNNTTLSVGSTSVSLSDLTASQSLVATYSVILKTRLTLNDVLERTKLPYTYEEVYPMVSASQVEETEVFSIDVVNADPREAQLIANTIVEVLPGKISQIVDGSSVRTVDYAVLPDKPVSPNKRGYAMRGALLGLLLSGSIVVLLELLDDQVHDEEYLIQNYELPVLAVIPDLLAARTKRGYKGYYASSGGSKE